MKRGMRWMAMVAGVLAAGAVGMAHADDEVAAGYGAGPYGYGPYPPMMGQPAPQGMRPRMMGPQQRGPNPMEMLELDQQQREQAMALMQEQHKAQWAHRSRMQTLQQRMRQLMVPGEPMDMEAIGQVQAEMQQAQREMMRTRVETHNRFLELLTEQQRERMRLMAGPQGTPPQQP